jgi:hypothetical protein
LGGVQNCKSVLSKGVEINETLKMTYKAYFSWIMIGLAVVAMTGCNKKAATGSASGSSSAPDPSPPVASAAEPLAINVSTFYDNTQALAPATFVETGTTVCAATPTAPHAVCTVQIPEGQLYFSTLRIQFAWLNSNTACRILHFQPYMYSISTAANTSIPWSQTPVDCSVVPRAAGCFGGAAAYVVPGFPQFTNLIYLPDISIPAGPQQSKPPIDVPSGFSNQYGSNRKTTNDLATAKRGTAIAANALHPTAGTINSFSEPYIANSMLDYTWDCRDDFYDPLIYTLQLNVREVDSASGSIDDISSWKEAP